MTNYDAATAADGSANNADEENSDGDDILLPNVALSDEQDMGLHDEEEAVVEDQQPQPVPSMSTIGKKKRKWLSLNKNFVPLKAVGLI